MAIATESKHFLSSPLVQTIVDDIYYGRVVFSIASTHSVLADNYKPKPIEVYNVRRAPFLDHYRLRVPRYGAILEFLNFAVLLGLFLLVLSSKYHGEFALEDRFSHLLYYSAKNIDYVTPFEVLFIIFATAFALEEYTASQEHGWDSEYVAYFPNYCHH